MEKHGMAIVYNGRQQCHIEKQEQLGTMSVYETKGQEYAGDHR